MKRIVIINNIVSQINIEKSQKSKKTILTYDYVINLLINSRKVKFEHPTYDIGCIIDYDIIKNDDFIYRSLVPFFDIIINSNELSQSYIDTLKSKYDRIITYSNYQIGSGNTKFDDEYEYYQIKKIIGNENLDHMMFREKDIELELEHGFDFNKKKIKFTKKNPFIYNISKLYNIPQQNIKNEHVKYYYLEKNNQYRPFNIKPMFNDIKEFAYFDPITMLREYHSKNEYLESICNEITNGNIINSDMQNNKMKLNEILNITTEHKENILIEYIKCRPNIFIITIWNPVVEIIDEIAKYLEKNGNVYYIKKKKITGKIYKNLMFWYYDEFTYNERLVFINKKLEYIDVKNEKDEYDIGFIVFDNVKNLPLAGQGSQFKRTIRDFILNLSKLDKNKYRGNDLVHINDMFYQSIEYAELIFNKNNIESLKDQNVDSFTNEVMSESNVKYQTLRKILYTDLSLLELTRFIIIGGCGFYINGIRAFNDLDGAFIDILPNESVKLIAYVENMFINNKTKIPFVDVGIQESTTWKEKWTDVNNTIIKKLNIINFKDVIINPINYIYFQGLKIVTLDFEILRKIIRNKTQDHIDFCMISILNSNYLKKYLIPTKEYRDDINDIININSYNDIDIKNYKIDNNNKFFIIANTYDDIKGQFDTRSIDNKYIEFRKKILLRRYSKNQIDNAKKTKLFNDFFGNIDI